MKWYLLSFALLIVSISRLLGQQNNPLPCGRFAPFNNPVFTFNEKIIRFNGGIGSNGFTIENRSGVPPQPSFEAQKAVNGIYDVEGNLLFYVTFKPSDDLPGRDVLYAKMPDGSEVNINQFGGFPEIEINNDISEIPIFPVPGRCGEYVVLHPGPLDLQSNNSTVPCLQGNNSRRTLIATVIAFNSATNSVESLYSKYITTYCGFFPKFAVGGLRRTASGTGDFNQKFYRSIYLAGTFGPRITGYDSQGNPYFEFVEEQSILAKLDLFEPGSYSTSNPSDHIFLSFNLLPVFNPFTSSNQIPRIRVANNESYPNWANQIKFLRQDPDVLVIATQKRPIHFNAGPQTVCNYPDGSPLHLLEQEIVEVAGVNQYRYTLKSVQSGLAVVNGVEIKDSNPFDNVIDYLFFSAPGIQGSNTIGIEKEYSLSNFCTTYDPVIGDKLPSNRQQNFRGIINPSVNQGHNSTLQLSVGYKYLVYGRQEGKVGLLDIANPIFFSTNDITAYTNGNHFIADVPPFVNNGKLSTNFQLFREGYGQNNSSMLPSCVTEYSFSNTSTLTGNPRIPANSRAQNFIEALTSTSIEPNTTADFRAGQKVHLKAGFHAKANSSFYAVAQPCTYQTTCCLAFEDNTPIPLMGGGMSGGGYSNLNNSIHEKKLGVFPNPASGHFSLSGLNADEVDEVQLMNVFGQEVSSWKAPKSNEFSLPVASKGVLYVVVRWKNGQKTALPLLVE